MRAAKYSRRCQALQLANRTGFISHFVIEGEVMAQQLRQLIQLNTLPELDQHRAQRILREINQHHRHKFAHFDENFVERLLNHPEVPELIRTSPLTQREWQVLGLIYSLYNYALNYVINRFMVLSGFLNFLSVDEIFHFLIPVSLGVGVGIGFLGSISTVRKHLHV